MKEICAVSKKCSGICKEKWGDKCPARYQVDKEGRVIWSAGGKT